jgi:DivIVA domain-containing protein
MAIISLDEIKKKTFGTHRMREGYDLDEVDDFLDDVVETVESLAKGAPINHSKANQELVTQHQTQLDKLNQTIQGLTDENGRLNEQILTFKADNSVRSQNAQAYQQAQQQIQTLTQQIQQQAQQLDDSKQAQEQIQALTQQVSEQAQQLEAAKQADEQIQVLTQQVNEQAQQLEEAKQAQEQIQALTQQQAQQLEEAKQAQDQIQTLTQQIEASQQQINQLTAQNESLTQEKIQILDRAQNIEPELVQLRESNATLSQEKAQLHDQVEALTEERHQQTQAHQQLVEEKNGISAQLDTLTQSQTEITQANQRLLQENQDLAAENVLLKTRNVEMLAELDDARERVDALEQQIVQTNQSSDQRVEDLRVQLQAAESKLGQLDAAGAEISRLTEQLVDANQKIEHYNQLEASLRNLQARNEQLVQELDQSKAQIIDLNQTLQDRQDDMTGSFTAISNIALDVANPEDGALQMLKLAREFHDQIVGKAKGFARDLQSSTERSSQEALTKAQAEANQIVQTAQTQARELMETTQNEISRMRNNAKSEKLRLDQEIARTRAKFEQEIDWLNTFESEYRSRLRAELDDLNIMFKHTQESSSSANYPTMNSLPDSNDSPANPTGNSTLTANLPTDAGQAPQV